MDKASAETQQEDEDNIPLLPTIDSAELLIQLGQSRSPLPVVKPLLKHIKQDCHRYFRRTLDADTVVRHRSTLIDQVLNCLWQHSGLNCDNLCLLAVGGYGRGELQPHSDIDLLLLLENEAAFDQHKDALQCFITLLWDLKLDIGHSVRTLDECVVEAKKDLTIITNMMEVRTLAGSDVLRAQLQIDTGADKLWSSKDFFEAKWQELKDRHKKHEDTEYNLEPNVKNSPGTLRDIQTINWMAMRHFDHDELAELLQNKFLTSFEFSLYQRSTDFLWQVRYALHMVTDREEDRLLFDLQKDVAEILQFEDDEEMLGVERMMLQFYRHQLALNEVTEMLLLYFRDDILGHCDDDHIVDINDDMYLCNGYLRLHQAESIANRPELLLTVFLEYARQDNAIGMHASTIRAIRDHRDLIDDEYRSNPLHQQLFLDILRGELRLSDTLKRMMRYNILGRYIPEFGSIIGHMEYDLFQSVYRRRAQLAYGATAAPLPLCR